MTNALAMMIDGLVALLLMLTIGYCMLLNRRLKLLKADEQSLRATISELVTATEIAERAIGGLKATVGECELGLTARLDSAERLSGELARGIVSGKDLLDRLAQAGIGNGSAGLGGPAAVAADTSAQWESGNEPRSAQDVAAAAQAFAERLRQRVYGLAA